MRASASSSPGSTHRLEIDDWQPTAINVLIRANRFERARLLAGDVAMVTVVARAQRIPTADNRRRKVSIVIRHTRKGKGRVDPDALFKSGLDALVRADLLVNDNADWLELGPVTYEVSPKKGIVFILEDLG